MATQPEVVYSGNHALQLSENTRSDSTTASAILLKPLTTYTFTAMAKVEAWSDAVIDERQQAHDTKRQAALNELTKQQLTGDERRIARASNRLPDAIDYAAVPPEGYINLIYYVTEPNHKGHYRDQFISPAITPGPWQPIELTFTTPAWAPYLTLSFNVQGGTLFIDDISFTEQ